MRRGFRLLVMVIFLCIVNSATGAAPPSLIFDTQEFPPFSFFQNGQPAGPGVEIITAVCAVAGINCSFRLLPWPRAQWEVKSGQANAMFLIGPNADRDQWLYYSHPMVKTVYGLFVHQSNPLTYRVPADIAHLKVGVFGPSNTRLRLQEIQQQTTGMTIDMTPDDVAAFKKLNVQRVDAVFSNVEAGRALITAHGLTHIRFAGFSDPVQYKIGFAKEHNDPAVVDRFNETYARLFRDGKVTEIYTRHGLTPAELDPELPRWITEKVKSDQICICGDKAEWPPYTYFKRDREQPTPQLAGYTVSVLENIFQQEGMRFKLDLIPWKRCQAEVLTGAYHMLVDASFNAERDARYYLSKPYYQTTSYYFYSRRQHRYGLGIEHLSDIRRRGVRVGGILGYNYMPYGLQNEAISPQCPNLQSLIRALQDGHCDLFLEKLEIVAGFAVIGKNYLSNKDLAYAPVPEVTPEAFYMMFVKNAYGQELKAIVDAGITRLAAGGRLKAFLNQYMP